MYISLSLNRGDEGIATPFTDVVVEHISTVLHSLGYQSRGNEVMYNGHTGRRMEAQIFIGPTYYQVCENYPLRKRECV
jgi:DNA-directed RNA polymerase II subunit RPB2